MMVQPCGPMLKFAFLFGGFSASRAKKKENGEGKEEKRGAGNETAGRIMRAEWMYIFWRDYCRFSAAARTILARGDKWRPWSPIGVKTARFVSVTNAGASRCISTHATSPIKIIFCRINCHCTFDSEKCREKWTERFRIEDENVTRAK